MIVYTGLAIGLDAGIRRKNVAEIVDRSRGSQDADTASQHRRSGQHIDGVADAPNVIDVDVAEEAKAGAGAGHDRIAELPGWCAVGVGLPGRGEQCHQYRRLDSVTPRWMDHT